MGPISKSSFALIAVTAVFAVTLAVAVAMYNSPATSDGQPSPGSAPTSAGDVVSQPEPAPAVQPATSPPASPVVQVMRQQAGASASAAVATTAPAPEEEAMEPAAVAKGEPSSSSPVTSTPVAEALAPLGDGLVTVFYYVAPTDTWVYYDPEFPDEGLLKAMVSGQEYLILVTESITVEVNGQSLRLVCSDDDCWNTVAWP